MAPKFKLTYFDLKGFGECIKYIFAYKKVDYELETICFFAGKDDWFQRKDSFPFGQVPVLEVDGKTMFQSQSICSYLADLYDLKTGDAFDDAYILAIASSMQDFVVRVALYYYTKDPEQKEILRVERETKIIPYYLSRFENALKERGDYFASKLTWADFYVVGALETTNGMMGRDLITNEYPALEGLMKRVWDLPGVKEYVAVRPPYNR